MSSKEGSLVPVQRSLRATVSDQHYPRAANGEIGVLSQPRLGRIRRVVGLELPVSSRKGIRFGPDKMVSVGGQTLHAIRGSQIARLPYLLEHHFIGCTVAELRGVWTNAGPMQDRSRKSSAQRKLSGYFHPALICPVPHSSNWWPYIVGFI